jgi:RNA 3'-terminal phosphate cyclase (ATP)
VLTIDAAKGEGGGQIVRSALALSLVTRKPFVLEKIRAGKSKPGLLPQHVAAVQAAMTIGNGTAEHADVGSTRMRFTPHGFVGGSHRLSVGPTGSAVLLAQMLIPALLVGSEPSEIVFEGGTHIALSPIYEFFADSYLSALRKMGGKVRSELWRAGFPDPTGGAFRVWVTPSLLNRPKILDRGRTIARRACGKVSKLPLALAENELLALERRLRWGKSAYEAEAVKAQSQGNALFVILKYENITHIVSEVMFSEIFADNMARSVADQLDLYLTTSAPVGEYLADQLIVPMAVAGGGSFRTVELTAHTRTQLDVVGAFFPELEVGVTDNGDRTFTISLDRR